MKNTQKANLLLFVVALFVVIPGSSLNAGDGRIPVIFDTDANNELDDQHALAYLVFNGDLFDVLGVTVNATRNGGDIKSHYAEAERVMKLCNVHGKIPLYTGANGAYETIVEDLFEETYDGSDAVEFIIETSRKKRDQKLVLMPVGKLTNIALAIKKAPDIKNNIRIVWLGANYPDPGEYNLVNDIPAMNYLLDQDVAFEMVMVRYGKPSGSDAVRTTPEDMEKNMPGAGVKSNPVPGRHKGLFTTFGDYSINLFKNIKLYGDPPSRALFDVVAVAVCKNPNWGEHYSKPAPTMAKKKWVERPKNPRHIVIWENFDVEAITKDFFHVINHPRLGN